MEIGGHLVGEVVIFIHEVVIPTSANQHGQNTY